VLVGRLLNHLKETKSIIIQPENKYYKNISIKQNEIQEVWQVSLKISPFLSSPRNPNEVFKYELQTLIQSNKILADNLKDLEKQVRDMIRKDLKTGQL
jgi:cell division protein FtsB